jgi:hypothetical protein
MGMRGIVSFSVRRSRVRVVTRTASQPDSARPPIGPRRGLLTRNSSQIADFYTDTGD